MHPDVALQSPHLVQQTKTMASSISQQLEDLLNPLPKFTDPEDDQDEGKILYSLQCVSQLCF